MGDGMKFFKKVCNKCREENSFFIISKNAYKTKIRCCCCGQVITVKTKFLEGKKYETQTNKSNIK